MKKVILALALVAFAATNSFAAAKPAKTMEFGVDAGINLMLSPTAFTDAYGLGVGGGAFGRYIINKTTSVGLDLAYSTFSGKTITGTSEDYPTFSTFNILAEGKQTFGTGSARPYVLGGVGLSMLHIAETTYTESYYGYTYTYTSPSVSETDLMLQPGFGVEFGTSTKFFVEARLNLILTSGDTTLTLPVNVGVQF